MTRLLLPLLLAALPLLLVRSAPAGEASRAPTPTIGRSGEDAGAKASPAPETGEGAELPGRPVGEEIRRGAERAAEEAGRVLRAIGRELGEAARGVEKKLDELRR